MVSITVAGDEVVLEVLGFHKFLALKSRISFKKSCIVRAGIAEKDLRPPFWRCPGIAIPWLFYAGTFHGKGRKEFWDKTHRGPGIRIELENGPYTAIVVAVKNMEEAIRMLK